MGNCVQKRGGWKIFNFEVKIGINVDELNFYLFSVEMVNGEK